MTLTQLLQEITDMFDYDGSGLTVCWSLRCWTDGYWSIDVIDNWHKWLDQGVGMEKYKYSTPEEACQAFIDYIKENDIDIRGLQGE